MSQVPTLPNPAWSAGGRVADKTAPVAPLRTARSLREQPRGSDEERAEPGQRDPAPDDNRTQERRGAPGAEQERQQESGVAE